MSDVINADGNGRRRLVPFNAGEPSWSPDGRRIAFARLPNAGAADVYLVNADGSGLRRLTQTLALEDGPVWAGR